MRALDVVGVDLELGFGIDARVVREQLVLVGLVGVGLLCGLVHVDLAAKDTARLAAENALVELVTLAVRLGVLDKRMIIDVLVAVFDVEAVEGRVYGLAREQGVHVVAAQLAPERYCSRAEAGGALLTHVGGGDVKGGIALALDAVVVDRGVLTDAYFV